MAADTLTLCTIRPTDSVLEACQRRNALHGLFRHGVCGKQHGDYFKRTNGTNKPPFVNSQLKTDIYGEEPNTYGEL